MECGRTRESPIPTGPAHWEAASPRLGHSSTTVGYKIEIS
jgi:hypothetical protein